MMLASTARERFHIEAEQTRQREAHGCLHAALLAKHNAAEHASIRADVPGEYPFWLERGVIEQQVDEPLASTEAFIKAHEASEHDISS